MFQRFVNSLCARPLLFCRHPNKVRPYCPHTLLVKGPCASLLFEMEYIPNTPIHNKESMGVDMKGILGFMP